jgi:hypothetical protein
MQGIYEMFGTDVSYLPCLSGQEFGLLEGHRHKMCPGETRNKTAMEKIEHCRICAFCITCAHPF